MTSDVARVLAESAHALPAATVAKRAGLPVEFAYADLVTLEARGIARVIVRSPHRGRPQCLWSSASPERRW